MLFSLNTSQIMTLDNDFRIESQKVIYSYKNQYIVVFGTSYITTLYLNFNTKMTFIIIFLF